MEQQLAEQLAGAAEQLAEQLAGAAEQFAEQLRAVSPWAVTSSEK